MSRALAGGTGRRRSAISSRAVASVAAALAGAAAAEGSAVLVNKLLTDGAAMAAACAVARGVVWMARALRRAVAG